MPDTLQELLDLLAAGSRRPAVPRALASDLPGPLADLVAGEGNPDLLPPPEEIRPPEQRGPLTRFLDVISGPQYTVQNLLRAAQTGEAKYLGRAGRALAHTAVGLSPAMPAGILDPFDLSKTILPEEARASFADVLRGAGVENKYALFAGGLAGDILLDPTTYIGNIGATGGARLLEYLPKALQAAAIGEKLPRIFRVGKAARAAMQAERAAATLGPTLAEKLGAYTPRAVELLQDARMSEAGLARIGARQAEIAPEIAKRLGTTVPFLGSAAVPGGEAAKGIISQMAERRAYGELYKELEAAIGNLPEGATLADLPEAARAALDLPNIRASLPWLLSYISKASVPLLAPKTYERVAEGFPLPFAKTATKWGLEALDKTDWGKGIAESLRATGKNLGEKFVKHYGLPPQVADLAQERSNMISFKRQDYGEEAARAVARLTTEGEPVLKHFGPFETGVDFLEKTPEKDIQKLYAAMKEPNKPLVDAKYLLTHLKDQELIPIMREEVAAGSQIGKNLLAAKPDLLEHADRLGAFYGRILSDEQKAGLIKDWRRGYVTHIYRNKEAEDALREAVKKGGLSVFNPFAEEREVATLLDALKAGLEPELNPVAAAVARLNKSARIQANAMFKGRAETFFGIGGREVAPTVGEALTKELAGAGAEKAALEARVAGLPPGPNLPQPGNIEQAKRTIIAKAGEYGRAKADLQAMSSTDILASLPPEVRAALGQVPLVTPAPPPAGAKDVAEAIRKAALGHAEAVKAGVTRAEKARGDFEAAKSYLKSLKEQVAKGGPDAAALRKSLGEDLERVTKQMNELEARLASPEARMAAGPAPASKVILPPEVQALIERLEKIEPMGPIETALNRFTARFIKPALTIWNPAFHVRNLLGGIQQGLLDENVSEKAFRTVWGKTNDVLAALGTGGKAELAKARAISFKTATGVAYNGEEAFKLAERQGVFGFDIIRQETLAREVADALRPRRAKLLDLPLGRSYARTVEDRLRFNTFVANLEAGLTPKEAAERARKFHVDYEFVSPTERRLRDIIPFYKFTREQLPTTIEAVTKRPRVAFPLRAAGTGRAAFADEGGEQQFLPQYLRENLAFPLAENTYLTGFGSVFEPLTKLGGSTAGRAVENVLSNLNPLLKAPLELATGRDFWRGERRQVRARAPALIDQYAPEFLRSLLGDEETLKDGTKRLMLNRTASTILQVAPGSRPFQTAFDVLWDERRPAWQRVLKGIGGVSVATVDQERELKSEVRQWLSDLADQGILKRYESYSRGPGILPPEVEAALKFDRKRPKKSVPPVGR